MPKYRMVGPDGKTYLMDAPEGVTPEQARQRLRQRISERIAATPTPAPTQRQAPQRTPLPTYSRVDQERNEINRLQTQYTRQLQEAQRELETITAGRDPRAVRDATIRQRSRINEAERQLAALRGRRTFLEEQGRPIPEISTGEQIGDLLAGIPRGAIRGVTSVPSILGIFGEAGEDIGRRAEEAGESAIRGLGLEQSEDVRTAIQYGTDPMLAQTSAFGEGLGSVVPFIGTSVFGAAAKGLAVAKNLDRTAKVVAGATAGTQAALGSGMGSAEARRRMDAWEEETGETLNPWTRRLVNFTGGAIGLSETLPINSLLNRLPGPVRQRFNKKLTDIISGAANKTEAVAGIRNFLSKATKYMDSSVLGRMTLRGFAPEAAQEGFAELSQNILQLSAYDPEQEVLEGVGESALLGGFVGKTVRGGAEATGAVVNKLRRMNAATVDTLEQARSEDPVSFDIIERDKQDPSKQIRQTIQVIAMEGDTATILRPDGTQAQLSLEALERRIAPDEGYEGFSTPEEFSSSNILGRLESSIGDIEDADAPALNRYITGVNSAISKALAFGNPREAVEYISQLETRFARAKGRKAKTTESKADIAMQNVLKEARSIVTDYQVEYAKSRAQPGAQINIETTEEAQQKAETSRLAALQESLRLRQQEQAARNDILQQAIIQPISEDPMAKFSFFEEQLRINGFSEPTFEETSTLRDQYRYESGIESADLSTEARRARDVMRERLNIIEPILRDNSIPNDQKGPAIDAALAQDGRPSMTEDEATIVFGRAIANDIFGPGGRMDQQRRAILERIRMDDSIPLRNKIREFNAALEQVPELAGLEPTAEEIALLTSEETTQDAPTQTTRDVKTSDTRRVEPSVPAPDERPAAERDATQQPEESDRRRVDADSTDASGDTQRGRESEPTLTEQAAPVTEETAPKKLSIKSVKQRRTVDQGTFYEVELSDGRVARIARDTDQFGPSDPVWYIEPESVGVKRADLPAMGMPDRLGATKKEALEALPEWIESNAPATRRAPPAPEEAAPTTEEVPQAPEVQEETVHSKLNENEKKRLAKHYGRKTYDEVAKRQFIQDFSNAVTNGINTVAKAIRGIIRRIQKSALAKAIVFAPATLIATTPSDVSATLEIAPAKVFKVSDQSLIPPETLAVMSSQAQATYEALAPAATSAGRPFMIADKPNGRLFIFGKDGVLHQETIAIYGRDEGDILSQQRLDAQSYEDLRASGGLQVTPSGVFDFRVVDNPKYPGQKVLALTSTDKTRRVGIGEREGAGVFVALHGNTVTTEARQRALASGDAEQSKQSMGCIVTSPEFFAQHIATDIDSISDAVVAIVPDVEANLDPVLAAAQTLSRRSDRLISRLQDAQTAQGVDIVAEPTLESTTADSPNISKPQMFGAIADLMDYIKKKFPTSPQALKSTLVRKLNYKYQDANDYAKALAGAYGVSIGEISPDMSIDRRFELFESRKTGNQMEVQRRFFRPIINLLKELDVNPDDVGLYLWARSAKDRNALIRERNASMPDGGSGLTNAEAELVIQSLEEAENGTLLPKIKKVVALHDRLVKYALKIRVDAGLLTQKQADAALEKQPFYTPLKGYATDGDMQLLGELELDGEGRYKKALADKGAAKTKAAIRKLRLGARPQEFYKAEGRTSIPLNPLFNLFADVQQVIMHAEKNRVSQSLLFNLLYYPEEHENIAQVYRDTDKVIRTEPSRDIAYPDGTPIRGNLGELAIKGEVLVVKVDKQTKKALNAKGISVSEGQTFFIQFKDTEAGQAIQRAFINMTPKQVNAFLRYSRNAAQGLKSMLTRYSPIYLYGTAYLRDTQDAIFTAYTSQVDPSSPAKGKKIAKDMRKYLMPTTGSRRIPFTETYLKSPAMSPLTGAIKNFITGRPPQSKDEVAFMAALQEMIEEGGSVGHAMIASAETLAADAKAELQTYANMRKRSKFNLRKYGSGANYLRQGAAKALDATAQTIDLNARLATYLAAKENGLTKEEAALLALDSSLNLTRRGELADYLDTLYFFTSPTIESGRKIYRQGVRGGAKFLRRVFYLGVLSAIWNSIFGAGDEDDDGESNYQEVPPYIKQTRLVMFYGAGQNDYISIPMGFLLALPKYLGEVTTETALGVLSSPEEAGSLIVDGINKAGAGTVNALSPIRGEVTDLSSAAQTFVPNIVRPVYDLFVNSNYFRSPIYRSQSEFDNRPASSLGKPGTPEIYSNFAKFMNAATGGGSRTSGIVDFQPEVYRYLATQYTGGLGRIADLALAKGIDPEKSLVEQLPILNTFVGRGAEYNPMNEYYELTGPRKGAPALDIIYKDFAGENATLTSQREIVREYGSKAPHLFDSRLLDAFNYAQGELDRLYKDRREELDRAGGDYEAKRRIRNRYMRQTSAIQSRFNSIYRIIEKEY